MAYSIARITVRNVDDFLAVMEGFEDMRGVAGSRGSTLYQSAEDGNELVVIQEWESVEKAQAFAAAPALVAGAKQAGVLEVSEVLYVESVREFEF